MFSLGVASTRQADLTEDDAISFTKTFPDDIGVTISEPEDAAGNPVQGGTRFPDAIAFSPDGSVIYSADEGELNFTGGRGFSAWGVDGTFLWDDNGLFENIALILSHYPEGRSENKGIEIEGMTTATFGRRDFLFVLSERGSCMAVFGIDNPARPAFLQMLPTGVSPEGVVALPKRGLLFTADEESGTLTAFASGPRPYRPSLRQPTLYSADGSPFAALSGLASVGFGDLMWSVPDNALPTSIFAVLAGSPYAPVFKVQDVMLNGAQARYDGEGIAVDESILSSGFGLLRGWWLASEGNAGSRPNLLVQVGSDGNVLLEVQLPASIDPGADPALGGSAQGAAGGQQIRSNGFEGVAVSADGRYLVSCIQRDFDDEFPTGDRYARIARYDLQQIQQGTAPNSGLRYGGDWEFFFVKLDSNDPDNWSGLSEIVTLGNGDYAVIERDKELGLGSQLKKVYAFTLNGLAADADGTPDATDTVVKVEVADIRGLFFPYEKVEGLALTRRGELWVGMDNDGGEVESRLVNIGRVGNPLQR